MIDIVVGSLGERRVEAFRAMGRKRRGEIWKEIWRLEGVCAREGGQFISGQRGDDSEMARPRQGVQSALPRSRISSWEALEK